MNLQERAGLYRKAFPKFQPLSVVETADGKQRLEGLWIMGQNYTVKSGYYGGYPHGYLDRVMSMFPNPGDDRLMHLFSGMIPPGDYSRFDRPGKIQHMQSWDREGDAEELSRYIEENTFDLIIADPPYSAEDAEHYGSPMVNRTKVLKECFKILMPGGWVIWLDQVFPMFSKEEFHLGMTIGMIKSTNHRVRAVFGFQKIGGKE